MRTISPSELDDLVAGADVLATGPRGRRPNVYRLANGHIVKLYRRHRILGGLWFRSRVRRYARHGLAVARRGFRVPIVYDTFFVGREKMQGLVCEDLGGEPIRDRLSADPAAGEELLPAAAALMAGLHEAGIYFRGFHLGNILLLDDGSLGLVDIDSMFPLHGSLRLGRRARNMRHIVRRSDDYALMQAFGLVRFLELYEEAAGLVGHRRARFRALLPRRATRFAEALAETEAAP